MTNEELIHAAEQSKLVRLLSQDYYMLLYKGGTPVATLRDFAQLIAKHEREECIKACKQITDDYGNRECLNEFNKVFNDGRAEGAALCAAAIRKRGEP